MSKGTFEKLMRRKRLEFLEYTKNTNWFGRVKDKTSTSINNTIDSNPNERRKFNKNKKFNKED